MADTLVTTQEPALKAGDAESGLRAHLRFSAGDLRLRATFALTAQPSVLFGPSGAGKSTLLRLLAGLLLPSSGVVTLRGRPLTDTARGLHVPAGKRGIGYLTQDAALFPHLSVATNIAFGLHGLLPGEVRRQRVDDLLHRFSLEPLATRRPAALSGGERRRVALARALAPSPELLLLDEPFTGLDQARKQATLRALDLYLEQYPTMVLTVSHDVAEVYASGAEVIMVDAGEIHSQGPAREVLAPLRQTLLQQLDAPTS